jgi:AraC-like DNA-binding protein
MIINGVSYTLHEGDFILVNSLDIHSIHKTQEKNLCLILQFDPQIISYDKKQKFQFNLNTISNLDTNISNLNEIRTSIAELGVAIYNKSKGYEFYIKSYLYKLIGDLFLKSEYKIQDYDSRDTGSTLETFLAINKYIEKNCIHNFTIEDLCMNFGMSKSSMYRFLKNTASITWKEICDNYRIEYAKKLLRDSKNSISYIIIQCGFKSDASFYRMFKNLVGTSPNQYRISSKLEEINIDSKEERLVDSSLAMEYLKLYI